VSKSDIDYRIDAYHSVINDILSHIGDPEDPMRKMCRRFLTYPEGEKVIRSLIRREKTPVSKDNQPPLFGIFLLQIILWHTETEATQIKPKERAEALDRVIQNATRLMDDLRVLGLPKSSFEYFTQDELYEQYSELFAMFDLPDELADESLTVWNKQIKSFLSLFCGEYPNAITSVDKLLGKLTDRQLLDAMAEPIVISKTGDKSLKRVYMIRQISNYFKNIYGKPLYETTANICVLVFDDTSIDRDTVRSALKGFDLQRIHRWKRELAPEMIKEYKIISAEFLENLRKKREENT